MGKERVVLEHHAEAPGHRLHPRHVIAVHDHATRVRRLEPRQEAERRGLAAPARSEERQHLAALQREGNAVDRDDAVEPLDQPFQPQEAGHRRASRPVPRTWRSQ